ncbi:hypothetical protein HanXRQr2_Chr01g0045281 [Helianthus annuus]|uniref:Uncharacterized protein n=1 Tax=Helianthus annuus TaxID=4232 RepID=A0A251VTV4_HELAN|nr:hypothetical protein HanXRQr2_Chr01g0045281 [Helianthus annuus]KAJ0958994.1 hypothetical protein HanPSC8_Chr01g0045001 [Helianthus annuus]
MGTPMILITDYHHCDHYCDNPNFQGLSSTRYLFHTGVFIIGLHCNCVCLKYD